MGVLIWWRAAQGYIHGREDVCGELDMQQKDGHDGQTV